LNLRKGWYKASTGYIYIWEPDHPNSNKHGYVAEHTKVMASMLGRPLLPEEEVHHRTGRETITALKILNCGLEASNRPELESGIW
jgi:hypothetical protein